MVMHADSGNELLSECESVLLMFIPVTGV